MSEGLGAAIIWCIVIVVAVYIAIRLRSEKKAEERKEAEHKARQASIDKRLLPIISEMQKNYDDVIKEVKRPANAVKIMVGTTVFGLTFDASKENLISTQRFWLWCDDESVNILPDSEHLSKNNIVFMLHRWNSNYETLDLPLVPTDIKLIKIPYEQIEYYSLQGQVERELHISGGGGGGSNITGAVIGGAIAGEAGAIIGSRQKIEKVSSYTTKDDKRYVRLFYNEDDSIKCLTLSKSAYPYLYQNIPEKEFEHAQLAKNSQVSTNSSADIKSRLEQLESLRRSKLISEEEYTEKRAEIMNRL